MQLIYRGQAYNVHLIPVEVIETEEIGTFMGKPYALKQYRVEQPEQPPEELTFMGQRYVRTAEPQPAKPRPGETLVNGKQTLQLKRSRLGGKQHPAFRGS